jgi:hypothetical protein
VLKLEEVHACEMTGFADADFVLFKEHDGDF